MKPDRIVRVLVLVLLLIGMFAAGQQFSGVTSAQARQNWEYQFTSISRFEQSNATGHDQLKRLSTLGDEGWEAVGMTENWVLLKRRK